MPKQYPNKPVNIHKNLATGQSLKEASSEKKVGGAKKDLSRSTNK